MEIYDPVKRLLFSLPPETAHSSVYSLLDAVQGTVAAGILSRRYVADDPRLSMTVFGHESRTVSRGRV